MKYTLLAISTMLFTGAVLANPNDDFVSLGFVHIKDGSHSGSGIGFTAARISDGKEFGVVSSFDYSEIDISNTTVQYYDAFVGPIYKPELKEWLRVYPLVGLAYANDDGSSNSSFAYGAGVQVSLSEQPYYFELNYKKVKDYDTHVVQLSAGYNF
jgi:opacity protein-like surface antigen